MSGVIATQSTMFTGIFPLVRFLNRSLDELGGLEKVKSALYKPQGYFSRSFGKESWKE